MRKKFIAALFLMICIIMTFSACGENADNTNDNQTGYTPPNYERIFSDDCVIAILTDEARVNYKNYTAESFADIDADSIEIYFDNIIFITLKNPGKENVLRAVDILNARPDIKEATPEYLETPTDE